MSSLHILGPEVLQYRLKCRVFQCVGSYKGFTLSTKVCIVKAMVFLVAMFYVRVGPQRRLNAEELMLSNCGAGEDS